MSQPRPTATLPLPAFVLPSCRSLSLWANPCAPDGLYSFGARWANAHFPAFWQYAIRPLDDFIFLADFYFLGIFSQEMSRGGGRNESKLKYFMPLYAFLQRPAPDGVGFKSDIDVTFPLCLSCSALPLMGAFSFWQLLHFFYILLHSHTPIHLCICYCINCV